MSAEVPLLNKAFVWQVISTTGIDESEAFKGAWVLLAVDKQIHRMGIGKSMKVDTPLNYSNRFSSFHKLSVSSDETKVAFYLDSSVLLVTSLDMQETHLEMDLSKRATSFNAHKFATLPFTMEWLDEETVALLWKNFLVIVDLTENAYEFFYPSFVRIQPEVSQ